MLYVFLGISILVIVIGVISDYDELLMGGVGFTVLFLISWIVVMACYNSTKATADNQIAVLEERNEIVLEQIEPLVNKYLEYEGSTYKDLKLNANTIVSMANYPQLKGDEFIQSQIKIIVDNQKKITDLKLRKARLNAYKMWIFQGE